MLNIYRQQNYFKYAVILLKMNQGYSSDKGDRIHKPFSKANQIPWNTNL